MLLKNKVAIITGGASGIGLATTRLFLKEGARVAICGRRAEALAEAKGDLKVSDDAFFAMVVDVSNPSQVKKFVTEVEKKFSHVDILVNNAGILIRKSLVDTDVSDWDETMAINLKGPYLLIRDVLPLMDSGNIINIASTCVQMPLRNLSAYSASKAGLVAMGKSLAEELKGTGKKVFSICPGPINTPLLQANIGQEEAAKKMDPSKVGDLCLRLATGQKTLPSGSIIVIGKVTLFQRGVAKIRRMLSL